MLKVRPLIMANTTPNSEPLSFARRIEFISEMLPVTPEDKPFSHARKVAILDELTGASTINSTISTDLVQKARQYTKAVDVPKWYQQYARVFSEQELQQFPPSRPWDHAIELSEGAPTAINCKIYPTTGMEDEALKEWLKDQLKKGSIQVSKSPYASLFFFIKKKDGKLRPVQDYQKLNKYTIKNKYLLPLIPKLITQVKDAWVFTKFDI
jgi:hypothetical protein